MSDFERQPFQASLRAAADGGAFIGTSSWKYPGWCGTLYDEQRYLYRGKLSLARFERGCLGEYAEVLPTVCVDAAYYRFPVADELALLAAQVPASFLFSFKVTAEVTLRRFPRLPRFAGREGQPNPHFLDPELFQSCFLTPCEAIGGQVGVLMFEFSRLHRDDFERGRDFVAALDRFLGCLPRGWRYGVEIRNPAFLHPEYFAMLRSHGVAHVFNSWSGMPPIDAQWRMEGSDTGEGFLAARFLLKPGRPYERAVREFSPYRHVREPYPAARDTGSAMIANVAGKNQGRKKAFLYVNNRLEGNALQTIAAMLEGARAPGLRT